MDLVVDFKKLMRTKEYKKNDMLAKKTLLEPHPAKMWKWLQEDKHFKGLEGLKKRFAAQCRRMREMSKKCPVARKLRMQMLRLGKIIKRSEMNKKIVNPPKFPKYENDEELEEDFDFEY
jgi:hypothetical protein